MNNWDIDGFGRDVKSTIQDAINTGDFSRLSRNINDTVSRAFGVGGGAPDIKLSHDNSYGTGTGTNPGGQNTGYSGFGTAGQARPTGFNQGHVRRTNTGRPAGPNGYNPNLDPNVNPVVPFVYRPVRSKSALSIVAMVAGYGIGGITLLSGAITAITTPLLGASVAAMAVGTLGIIALPFIGLGVFGTFLHKKCKRFKNYINIIGNRQVCNIDELAKGSGKKEKAIVTDVTKLIHQGWFCQGHLDQNQKCLMLTDKAYGEYQQIMAQRTEQEQRQAAAEAEKQARAAAEQSRQDSLDPEIRDLIKQGEEYIRIIRQVNDEVPGEEVSNKMYKMEDLVRRIFKRVEEKPEQAGDLKRLMNYYLPTSIKLLEAYADMDKQEVQGENIQNSKREIEETLDTLNVAYEKFLDDMFRDTAWDVSSDVSVLKTMLAREGLTENEFEKAKK